MPMPGLPNPSGMPVSCGDCGAHFQLDPSGDIAGASCSECGGGRFFRSQPSATGSPGTLRDMVDSDSQIDQGGNPLGEGTIMGNDGEQPMGKRDNYMHSKVAMPRDQYNLDPEWQPEIEVLHNNVPYRDYWGEMQPDTERGTLTGFERWVPPVNAGPNADPPGNWKMRLNVPEGGGTSIIDPQNVEGYKLINGQLPQPPQHLRGQLPPQLYEGEPAIEGREAKVATPFHMQYEHSDIPPDTSAMQWRQNPTKICPMCGGDYSQDPLGYSHHVQEAHPGFGLNNGEFTVAKRVEPMRTLNMEPYPPLWDESYIKTGFDWNTVKDVAEGVGGAAALAAPWLLGPEVGAPADAAMIGAEGAGAAGVAGAEAAGVAGAEGAAGAAGAAGADVAGDAAGGMSLLDRGKQLNNVRKTVQPIMKGVMNQGDPSQPPSQNPQAGGMAPEYPAPTPSLVTGAADIPWLLLSDYDTPHSVKSVDEMHDDPEHQDQKEFNDGDQSPSNPQNPNLEDSGVSGEDGVRDATPGYGFGENSPAIERAMMLMPLLLHYFESEESGEADPIIKGLHEALEKENPGYMDQPEDPDSHQTVQLMLQQHKQHQANTGTCGSCGGPLAADGTCPTCGHKTGIGGGAFGAQPLTGGGASGGAGGSGGPSYPPNRVGRTADNQVGPQTPEQKAAVIQLLEQQGRHHEVPMVELEPWRFAQEMAEISQQPNVAPLVQTPPQTPPMGMQNPQGGMPVNDPSQPGGGGAQPMQPMSMFKHAGTCNMCGSNDIYHDGSLYVCKKCGSKGTDESSFGKKEADANNAVPRCPKCKSATTSVHALGDNTTDGTAGYYARCHACDHQWNVSQKVTRVIMAEMPNPNFKGENTMTWIDHQGNPLMVGQTYELRSPQFSVPDEIKIISKKPDELGVKLVGDIAGITSNDSVPDFTITPQQVQSSNYEFVPSNEADQVVDHSKGGMPGLEQIPQAPPTTDEASSTYPNRGTVSHTGDNIGGDIFEVDEDVCHKCGNNWITHTVSSSTQTMHECARCGVAWETKDEFNGREANADLAWVMEDSSEDFFAEMERHHARAGGISRDIHTIAANDDRYQTVKQVLNNNKMQREAGRHFTPGEQRELINERGKARNLDMLDIEDTHYATQYLPGTANEMNAPDGHLIFGL